MDKEYIIKSLNMECDVALTLEKAKDRVEFEALSVYLMTRAFDTAYNQDRACSSWVIPKPDPCSGQIPEPNPPICVKWYNPPCDHHPTPTPNPTPNPTPLPDTHPHGD